MIMKSVDFCEVSAQMNNMFDNTILSIPDGFALYKNENNITKQGITVPAEYLDDLCDLYDRNAYIVKYRTIYEARRTAQGNATLAEVYRKADGIPFTKRGRWYCMSAKEVNELIGYKLFNEVE